MTLTRKISLFITTLLATFCAVFSVATLQPATAFAYEEKGDISFRNTSTVEAFGVGGTFENPEKDNFINYNLAFDTSNYASNNIKVTFEVGLYSLNYVSTGLESINENVTYADLKTTSYTSIEKYKVIQYYRFSRVWTEARRTEKVLVEKSLDAKTLTPYIYIANGFFGDGTVSAEPFETWFNSISDNVFSTGPHVLDIAVRYPSSNVNYVLGASMKVESYIDGSGSIFSARESKDSITALTTTSPIKSASSIVYEAVTSNTYDSEEQETLYATLYSDYVDNALTKDITVKYLTPIANNVPFAKKVSKDITVKLNADGTVNAVDVCQLVGVPYFELFGTIYNGIEQTSENVFTVTYPCDLWLASKTVDGKTVNHFLNVNVSYQEYFYPFVADGIIEQGLYEYLFATAVTNKYPEVSAQGLSYGDVYGYWDYVALPETVTLNTLLANVLDVDAKYKGFTKEFHYESSISKSAYQKLLSDYNYSWLESGWNSIFGTGTSAETHNATHYVLICDPYLKDGLVSDSGDEDKNAGGSVGDQAGDDLGAWVGNVFDGIGDFLTGKGPSGSYIIILVAGAGVLLGLYFVNGGRLPTFNRASAPKKQIKTRSNARKKQTRSKNYGKDKKKRS